MAEVALRKSGTRFSIMKGLPVSCNPETTFTHVRSRNKRGREVTSVDVSGEWSPIGAKVTEVNLHGMRGFIKPPTGRVIAWSDDP